MKPNGMNMEALAFFNERGERLGNAYLAACKARGIEPAPAAWMHNIKNPSQLLVLVFVGIQPVEISTRYEADLVALAVDAVARHEAQTKLN